MLNLINYLAYAQDIHIYIYIEEEKCKIFDLLKSCAFAIKKKNKQTNKTKPTKIYDSYMLKKKNKNNTNIK